MQSHLKMATVYFCNRTDSHVAGVVGTNRNSFSKSLPEDRHAGSRPRLNLMTRKARPTTSVPFLDAEAPSGRLDCLHLPFHLLLKERWEIADPNQLVLTLKGPLSTDGPHPRRTASSRQP